MTTKNTKKVIGKRVASQTLTRKEWNEVERTSGLAMTTLEDPNYPKTDMLYAMGWVIAKRTDPKVTFEEYSERTFEEVGEDLGREV